MKGFGDALTLASTTEQPDSRSQKSNPTRVETVIPSLLSGSSGGLFAEGL